MPEIGQSGSEGGAKFHFVPTPIRGLPPAWADPEFLAQVTKPIFECVNRHKLFSKMNLFQKQRKSELLREQELSGHKSLRICERRRLASHFLRFLRASLY